MALPRTRAIRFGEFEADFRTEELRKAGVRVKLHHQTFQLLTILIERAGEVVTRDELKNELWGSDTFVDFDVGLNSLIKKLREALNDSAEYPRYIETLPRKGYRFIASISQPSTSEATEGLITKGFHRWTWLVIACALIGLLFIGKLVVSHRHEIAVGKSSAVGVHIRSIAVLPFENLSGDPAEDSFVDGVTDALITNLAQISSLRVISRTSAMRYKNTRKPLPEIGKELNVDAIVEGTVVKSAERMRVNAQLIQTNNDQHLWAGTYERNLGDVVDLQSEIARGIADSIQIQLTPNEDARLARRRSVNPEAFEAYLRGRYFLDKWTEPACGKSIEYFQDASRKDPNYALAYAGMAEAVILLEDIATREGCRK